MRLCSKLTPHKSTWSADEAPFISAVFLLGTRSCAERLLLIWRCDSLSYSFKSKIMKRGGYETSEKDDLHRVLKGKKIWVKQAAESLISIKWLFGFISPTGVPPFPPPVHHPPLPLDEDACAVYSAAQRPFNHTGYTNSCYAGWKAAKHTWLVKKPVNYIDRMTRVIKRIHAAFTFRAPHLQWHDDESRQLPPR